jgi:hypothetical protein
MPWNVSTIRGFGHAAAALNRSTTTLRHSRIAPHIPGPHTVREIAIWLDELAESSAVARHPDSGVIEFPLLLEIFEKQDAAAERKRKSRDNKEGAGLD